MTEHRLTTEFWIQAYLTLLRLAEIPVFVTTKGDATAGAVLVKLNTLDGQAKLFQRMPDLEGSRIWTEYVSGTETEVDAAVERQKGFDPDIWVLEVEDREGRHLLNESGLSG